VEFENWVERFFLIKLEIYFFDFEVYWIKIFFSHFFDIETTNMNSQLQVNYEISCRFENDSLMVSGVPHENFRDKILIIEIANR